MDRHGPFALSSNHLYGQEEEHTDNNEIGGFPMYLEVILTKYLMAVILKNGKKNFLQSHPWKKLLFTCELCMSIKVDLS